jgi:hypothetical protein
MIAESTKVVDHPDTIGGMSRAARREKEPGGVGDEQEPSRMASGIPFNATTFRRLQSSVRYAVEVISLDVLLPF